MEEKNISLASEMYADLKETDKFLRKLLIAALVVIGVLVIALAGTNIYHVYQWSQFDTIIVDGGDYGYANYVDGENSGGIYNGSSSSAQTQEQ